MPSGSLKNTTQNYGRNSSESTLPDIYESNKPTDWYQDEAVQDLYPDDPLNSGLCPLISSPYLDDHGANSHNTQITNGAFADGIQAPFYQSDLDVLVNDATAL